jgi:hypothetical protein
MGLPRCNRDNRKRTALVGLILTATAITFMTDKQPSQAVQDHLSTPKHFARVLHERQGATVEQWQCLKTLWTLESHWNHKARNPSSGAYGIPQALPASKMLVIGEDYRYNWQTQVRWGLLYIKLHWSNSACNALRHEYQKGWY